MSVMYPFAFQFRKVILKKLKTQKFLNKVDNRRLAKPPQAIKIESSTYAHKFDPVRRF